MISRTSRVFASRFFLLAVVLSVMTGCPPKIINFTPETGNAGADVTITGEYFGATAADNVVKFADNVTAANISVPQSNRIIAKVPAGAKTGLISVTTTKGTGKSSKNFVVPGGTKWTFMVYIDGDNNLEDAAIDDFLEMAAVGSTKDVKIVVQMDRAPGYTTSHGDWKGTKRFLVQKGDTPSVAPLQDLGEANMGDPAVLQAFVEWGITNYPAEHYLLSIWNHGGGWRDLQKKLVERVRSVRSRGESDTGVARAVAWDDTDGDVLYMKEVQQALETAKQGIEGRTGTSVKLDVVGFDACLMGMVEVAYALRNAANCVVGSEQTEPNDGWPYDTILTDLVATPSFTARDLSGLIVTKYKNSYSGSGITQAAVDLSGLSTVISKIDNFTGKAAAEWPNLKNARASSMTYHPGGASYWGVDLWGFADNAYSRVTSTDIKTAALELKNAIDAFVVNELHSSDMAGSHGVAVYFPETLTAFNSDPDHTGYQESNTFMPVDFVNQHRWDNWLQTYYSNIP